MCGGRSPQRPSGGSEPRAGCVLIVDDNAGLAEVLAYILTDSGYRPCIAQTTAEGRRRIARGGVDALITHHGPMGFSAGMPTGLHLARWAKDASPELPVIMFSAHPPAEASRVCDLVLTKTMTHPTELPDTLRRLGVEPSVSGEW